MRLRQNMAWRGRIENDRARIAIAAKGDASGSIDKDAIERIAKTPAERAGVIGASPRKTVGANAEGRIGGRSGECAAAAIAKIAKVRLDAGHKGADLIIVARLKAAGDPRILAAAIWDKVEAGRGKANCFIAGIGGGRPGPDSRQYKAPSMRMRVREQRPRACRQRPSPRRSRKPGDPPQWQPPRRTFATGSTGKAGEQSRISLQKECAAAASHATYVPRQEPARKDWSG